MKSLLRIGAASSCLMFIGFLAAQNPTASEPAAPTSSTNTPSDAEIGELTAKASEKVEAFQKTLDAVKPLLDNADPSAYGKDESAVMGARLILGALKKNGQSAYALVSLLATLDDLDLDATQDSTQILLLGTRAMTDGKSPPDGWAVALTMLTSTATGLYDISELVMHATLRLVSGEEVVLSHVFADKK